MGQQIVYIDESGNAGDVAGHPAPFADQATFALVGVLEANESSAAERIVRELRSRHRLQAEELKWKSFANKPNALLQLIREMRQAGLLPFVELMDKRHYVANNIVTHVLARRRADLADPSVLRVANDFANLIASEVGDDALLAYARFAKEPTMERFEEFILLLRTGIDEASEAMAARQDARRWATLMFMDEVLDDVLRPWYAAGAADVQGFVQEPDQSVGGHRLGLLPQVQAFSNLCARLNAYGDSSEFRLIHDEQNEFGALLQRYFSLLTSNEYGQWLDEQSARAHLPVSWTFPAHRFRLSFGNSAKTPGIQIADVLAGFCRSRLDSVIGEARADERFDTAAHELIDCAPPAGILFVTTEERIAGFRNDFSGAPMDG